MKGEVSTTNKKALNAVIKGLTEASSIEIDSMKLPGVIKDILNGVVKSVETAADNALVNKRILEKMDSMQEAGTVKRQPDPNEARALTEPKETKPEVPANVISEPAGDF